MSEDNVPNKEEKENIFGNMIIEPELNSIKEGININKSLLALGLCINVLASKSKSKFVPWRNSKLTRILKDSLGGNSRIVMISNVSPSTFNVEETLNTLIYSNRAKNIQTIIKKNIINTADRDSQVNKYDEIISNLTSELELLRQQLAVKQVQHITNIYYLKKKYHRLIYR